MSCGVGRGRGSDLALMWLWHRPVATALIRPLAWEPPHALGAALEKAEKAEKKKEWRYIYIYMIHFAVHLKLIQDSKSTVLPYKFFKVLKNENRSSHRGSAVNEHN